MLLTKETKQNAVISNCFLVTFTQMDTWSSFLELKAILELFSVLSNIMSNKTNSILAIKSSQ